MKKALQVFIALLLLAQLALAGEDSKHNYKPEAGYVSDAETAIKIAVAVWSPIYGEKQIASEKPYNAVLTNGVWIVQGSLSKGFVGGVAVAEIAKDDGKILRISHGK
jgi:hypothetical protein